MAFVNVDRFTDQIKEYTYRETYEKVGRLANCLVQKFGLTKGEKVLIYTSNLYESVVVSLACARIGCIHFLRDNSHDPKDLATQIDFF